MDPVNKKALKGDFKDRADKDIDNDGKVDSTDKYLHARRKAVSKAIAKEEVELDEKVEISHDRYMRSHGKKAKGTGNWAFTTKRMGDPGKDEMVFVSGNVASAGKEAAKKLGSDVVYVMEEVELDEVSTEKLRDYASAALQDKNKAKADKRWKYASKAMKTVGDREAQAAAARKYNKMEEVEQIDEISADLARRVSSKRMQQASDLYKRGTAEVKSGQLRKSLDTGDEAAEKERKAAKSHAYAMKALDRVKKMKESTYLHNYIRNKDDV